MDREYAELAARVERLERLVEALGAAGTPPQGVARPAAPQASQSRTPPRPTPAPPRTKKPRALAGSGDVRSILRFVGIGLLLFGVGFLFTVSTHESDTLLTMRVCIGILLGIGLAVGGKVLLARDRAFAQVLTGGAIGVWYICGFAAYQLFGLVPAAPAFSYMGIVTVLAFAISLRQSSLALTIVATLGGLATPFLLFEPGRDVSGSVIYLCLVAVGAMAIYVRREWRPLLWTTLIASGLAIYTVAAGHLTPDSGDAQRWTVQTGMLLLWALFAVGTAVSCKHSLESGVDAREDDRLFIVAAVPFAGVIASAWLWDVSRDVLGELCVATAFIYAVPTLRLRPSATMNRLTNAHFLVAAGMAAFATLLLVEGEPLAPAVATEALVLRVLRQRGGPGVADIISHALFVIAGYIVLTDLITEPHPGVPVLNATGISMLWADAALTAAAFQLPGLLRRRYLYAAHAVVLLWVFHEFAGLAGGQGIVTSIWGLYGAGLLIAGLRRSIRPMRSVGMVTLFVVVAKLFLVDLESVRAIWRVLLFIGFGGVFLALSYWFLSLDRSAASAAPSPPPPRGPDST